MYTHTDNHTSATHTHASFCFSGGRKQHQLHALSWNLSRGNSQSIQVEYIQWHQCVCIHAWLSHSVVSDSLHPQGLESIKLLCPWDFTGKKHWRALPFFFTPGDLPNPGIESVSLVVSCIGRRILYHSVTWEASSDTKATIWVLFIISYCLLSWS